MEVIIPAAAKVEGKPRYLMYDYKHQLALRNVARLYTSQNINVTVAIRAEDCLDYAAFNHVENEVPGIGIVVLDEETKGPADTVYQVIKKRGWDKIAVPILVKDSDSWFTHQLVSGNYVCVSNVNNHNVVPNLTKKSFVKRNNHGYITDIVEKAVVSEEFCTGGYHFENSMQYVEAYEKMSNVGLPKIYVSHIIQYMIGKGHLFITNNVLNYTNVGSLEEWLAYNNHPVIFCDIDGTLVEAQSRHGKNTYADKPIALQQNVDRIKALQNSGCQIVFTTARPKEVLDVTVKMLEEIGFENPFVIIGLYNSTRILINDYNDSNPYPRAIAINIERNNDNLKDFL
jgi:hypothetical protein